MASLNKKRKCHNTLLDRGGEKGKLFRLKHCAMFHKKDRNHNKKMCKYEMSLAEVSVRSTVTHIIISHPKKP